MARFCMKCGRPLADNSRFCMNCGTPVPDLAGPVKEGKAKPAEKRTSPAPARRTAIKKSEMPAGTEKRVKPAARKTGKPDPGSGSFLKKLLLVILAVELGIMAFRYPGFLRKKEPGNENRPAATVSQGKDPYAYLSKEAVGEPEWPYHSKPVDITPVKGINITAGEGQLFDDTVLSLHEYRDDDEDILALNQQLAEDGIYMIGAWEFDAGLAEGQSLPGEYTFTMDLDELGVPADLQPLVTACRIGEDGQVYEFDSETENGKLTFSGNKNCPILLTIGIGAVVLGAALGTGLFVKEELQKKWYYTFAGKGTFEGDHKYGKYKVVWKVKDVDYNQYENMKRLEEIQEKCREKAQKEYDAERAEMKKAGGLYYWFGRNESVSSRLVRILQADKDFQKYSKLVKIPEVIQMIIEKIDIAFTYLGDEGAAMPRHRVEFLIRDELDKANMGEEVSALFHSSYILVGVGNAKDLMASAEKKDNLLLTLTHELFHVWQENYRLSMYFDSNTFDEMATLVLESDAKDYYKENGIITTDPDLTNTGNLLTLMNPMDNYHSVSLHRQQQGYVLKEFVMFLRRRTGMRMRGTRIMANRSFWETPVISKILMSAFKISEYELDQYWRQWCAEPKMKKTFGEAWWEDKKDKIYKFYDEVKLKENEGTRFAFASAGDYTAAVRAFMTPKNEPTALLIIMDSVAADDHPEMTLIPCETSKLTPFGAFVEPRMIMKAKKLVPAQRRFLIESYGVMYGKKYNGQDGYTVWPLSSPAAPAVSAEKEYLGIRLPADIDKCGVIDGVRLNIVNKDGKKLQYDVKKARLGEEIRIGLDDVRPADKPSEYQLTVTLEQYVVSRTGQPLYIPESRPAAVTVNESDGKETVFGGLYLYRDQICGFDADTYDVEDSEDTDYTSGAWPGGITVKIRGDQAEIFLPAVDYTLKAQDKEDARIRMSVTDKRGAVTVKALINDRRGNTWYGVVTDCSPSTISGSETLDMITAEYAGYDTTYIHDYGVAENALTLSQSERSVITLYFNDANVLTSGDISFRGKNVYKRYYTTDEEGVKDRNESSESERSMIIKFMK